MNKLIQISLFNLAICFLFVFPAIGQNTFTEKAANYKINLNGEKDGGLSFGFLNGDQHLDLIVNTFQDDVNHRTRVYFYNPSTKSFDDVTAAKCKGCIAPGLPGSSVLERSMVIADFNNDGANDFVRNSAERLEVYLNNGSANGFTFGKGSNQEPNFVLFTTDLTDPTDTLFRIPGGMNTEGIGVLDFDNDGDLDLFIENHNWGMEIYRNKGFASGEFEYVSPQSIGLPVGALNAGDGDYASVTDFNDDGYVDIIARKNEYIEYDFAVNNPENPGNFINALDIQDADNDNKGSVSLYDFDNDGDFDLIWTAADSTIIYQREKFGFTPLPQSITGISPTIGNQIDGLACGDIDNDGDIDIFLADDQGESFLFINQINDPVLGSNSGQPMQFVQDNRGINLNGDGEGCVFVDFDQDGDLDLYVNMNGKANQYWENDLNNATWANGTSGNTISKSDDYLFVKILEDRDENANHLGTQRLALGATVKLKDCCGKVISGVREVNGGNGHGTQDPSIVHFGLPDGPLTDYIVEVRYPAYLKNGKYERDTVEFKVIPSELPNHLLVVRAIDETDETLFCNKPPVAVNDTLTGFINTDIIGNVLDNDSDPNNDPIVVDTIPVIAPEHGTLELNSDGSFAYTPDSTFTGEDQFTYKISDPCGVSDEAIVFLTILPCKVIDCTAPIANEDVYVLPGCTESFQGSVFANDTTFDCSGKRSFELLTVPDSTFGKFDFTTFASNGLFTFEPDSNYFGTFEFSYKLCTKSAQCGDLCDSTTVKITVEECITCLPPALGTDFFSFHSCPDTFKVNFAVNDTLPANCDQLVYNLVQDGKFGKSTLNQDGILEYVLDNPGYVGMDTLVYAGVCIDCESEPTAIDTTTIVFEFTECEDCENDKPQLADHQLEYDNCSPVITGNLAENAVISPNCDSLIFSADNLIKPVNGKVVIKEDGKFTYTLNDPNFVGVDTFSYIGVCAGCEATPLAFDTARVYLNITTCPDTVCKAPSLEDDYFVYIACDTTFDGIAATNDVMPNNCDSLIFELVGDKTTLNGSINFRTDGSFTYTLNDTSYTGVETFQYRAVCFSCEGTTSAYDTATISIEIQKCPDMPQCYPPELMDDELSYQNCTSTFLGDVSINDIFPDSCNMPIFQLVEGMAANHGDFQLQEDGKFVYTLYDSTFVGTDSIQYVGVCMGCEAFSASFDTAWVKFTITECVVPPCPKPELGDDSFKYDCENGLTGNALENDILPPTCKDPKFFLIENSRPLYGEITFNENGTFKYLLTDLSFKGIDSLQYYVVCEGCTETGTVYDTASIYIDICCDKPVAENDAYDSEGCESIEFSESVAANDSLTEFYRYAVLDNGETKLGGTVDMDKEGFFTYTPPVGQGGTDEFMYTVCSDDCNICDTATVTITRAPIKVYELVTPDDSGQNDIWYIDNISCYPNNVVKIFNRWGNLVFEKNGYKNDVVNSWYGQVNKNTGISVKDKVPDGTYFYIIDLGDGSDTISGYVEIRGTTTD
ncbi:Ig-like domain-containing protein [Flexithrix dorotheae]|uniref:Ig-like domain-containing protein n=1 Tax=Flexithrix dorotheae TaxID=70993 RepID=UPI000378D875|nr:Ig-like domain-containing protein [Flexithrix dorotheae]